MSAPGFVKPATSLFVVGMSEDMDEDSLARHFERLDRTIRVRSINVLRNYQTLRSRGTAVVEFASPEDAEKALQVANYSELAGREIRCMWYRPGGLKDRVTGNVFVKNLPADLKSKDLYDFFCAYGKIFSCNVRYDSKGACRGYGYVQFETKEATEKALAEANGKVIRGSKIEVCPFKARESRSSSIAMYNNLFVKSIPKKYTNQDLQALFTPYGEIVSAVVIKERQDAPENKGFGFVCFKKVEDAKTAEEKMQNAKVDGQPLYVCRALPLEEHRRKVREERLRVFKDCNVYVKNLPDEATDELLHKEFEQFGHVVSARVMMERKQDPVTGKTEFKSKNFGFVCFSTKEEAKKAIAAVAEGRQIFGRPIFAAIAEKKEDRMSKFTQGFYPMQMYGMPPMYRGAPPRHRRPPHV